MELHLEGITREHVALGLWLGIGAGLAPAPIPREPRAARTAPGVVVQGGVGRCAVRRVRGRPVRTARGRLVVRVAWYVRGFRWLPPLRSLVRTPRRRPGRACQLSAARERRCQGRAASRRRGRSGARAARGGPRRACTRRTAPRAARARPPAPASPRPAARTTPSTPPAAARSKLGVRVSLTRPAASRSGLAKPGVGWAELGCAGIRALGSGALGRALRLRPQQQRARVRRQRDACVAVAAQAGAEVRARRPGARSQQLLEPQLRRRPCWFDHALQTSQERAPSLREGASGLLNTEIICMPKYAQLPLRANFSLETLTLRGQHCMWSKNGSKIKFGGRPFIANGSVRSQTECPGFFTGATRKQKRAVKQPAARRAPSCRSTPSPRARRRRSPPPSTRDACAP